MAGTFFKQGRIVLSTATTATAAGTTVLTASSEMNQQFTGTTTQQVNLPDASTLQVGAGFTIMNRSTGVVTVKFNDGTTTAATLEPNTQRTFVVIVASAGNGTWDVSTGGGDSAESTSFGINYMSDNPDAETDTTGYATYADAAGTSPVDGTGGSPTVTWTRSTSSPLRGTASFLFTKDAANRQGEGASYDFLIDDADKGRMQTGECELTLVSGTFVTGDLTFYIVDVTNGTVIQPSAYQIVSTVAGYNQKAVFQFQAASNSTSYRLCIHVASTSASAYVLKFDTFRIGPTQFTYGVPVTDWVAYTPTFGGFGTVSAVDFQSRRVGDSLEVFGNWTNGTVAASAATITVGHNGVNANVSVDSSKVSTTGIIGSAATALISTTQFSVMPICTGTGTSIGFIKQSSTIGISSGALNGDAIAASSTINSVHFVVPIVGWSSNVQVSSDADTRVVSMSVRGTTSNQTAITTAVKVTFITVDKDTHGALSSSTYTVPSPGEYDVDALVTFSNAGLAANQYNEVLIYKNGAEIARNRTPYLSSTSNFSVPVKKTISCVAGDTLEIYAGSNGSGATIDKTNNSYWNNFNVNKRSGPAQIAASEKVFVYYSGNAATALTANVTNIDFATKAFDSHGAWNGTTFTAPRPGWYEWKGLTRAGATSYSVVAYRNGSSLQSVSTDSASAIKTFNGGYYLNAGDTITFRSDTNTTLSNSGQQHYLMIASQG